MDCKMNGICLNKISRFCNKRTWRGKMVSLPRTALFEKPLSIERTLDRGKAHGISVFRERQVNDFSRSVEKYPFFNNRSHGLARKFGRMMVWS
jgi:hypothetical protein